MICRLPRQASVYFDHSVGLALGRSNRARTPENEQIEDINTKGGIKAPILALNKLSST